MSLSRSGVLGGAYAAILGGLGALANGAALLLISGWGQGPRSDAERLDAAFMSLAIVPIVGVALLSLLTLGLGVAAIRDARGARTGVAAYRLLVLFGLATLGAGYALQRSPSAVAAVLSLIAGLGAWLNAKGYATRRPVGGSDAAAP